MTDEKHDAIAVVPTEALTVSNPTPDPNPEQAQLEKVLREYEGVIPPDKYVQILTTGNYSNLQESECAKFLFIHAVRKGLNPWKQPYIFIVNKDGKRVLYATKEASAQLRANRQLRPVLLYAGFLRVKWAAQVLQKGEHLQEVQLVPVEFDATVYETEWKVLDERDNVIGWDVGAGTLDGLVGRERKDEIMKIYTRGKRRAILDATGITENDESEADNDDSIPTRMARGRAGTAALPPGPKRVIPKPESPTEAPSQAQEPLGGAVEDIPFSDPVTPTTTSPIPPVPTKRPSRPPIAAPLAKA